MPLNKIAAKAAKAAKKTQNKRQEPDEFGPWDTEVDEFGSWADKREAHHTDAQVKIACLHGIS